MSITHEQLIKIIDGACWDARRFGHDDYGLEYGVTLEGVEVEIDEDNPESDEVETYHPSAYEAAKEIRALLEDGTP